MGTLPHPRTHRTTHRSAAEDDAEKVRFRRLARRPAAVVVAKGMQVTDEDLRRQCAEPHARYILCIEQAGGIEGAAARCQTERLELEQCATATVQMVKTINANCGALYSPFQEAIAVPSSMISI